MINALMVLATIKHLLSVLPVGISVLLVMIKKDVHLVLKDFILKIKMGVNWQFVKLVLRIVNNVIRLARVHPARMDSL